HLVEVKRLRIPGTGKSDDAVLAEVVPAEIENLAHLAILEKQIGLAAERAGRRALPKVQLRLGLILGLILGLMLCAALAGALLAGAEGRAQARELVGDPVGDDGAIGSKQFHQ